MENEYIKLIIKTLEEKEISQSVANSLFESRKKALLVFDEKARSKKRLGLIGNDTMHSILGAFSKFSQNTPKIAFTIPIVSFFIIVGVLLNIENQTPLLVQDSFLFKNTKYEPLNFSDKIIKINYDLDQKDESFFDNLSLLENNKITAKLDDSTNHYPITQTGYIIKTSNGTPIINWSAIERETNNDELLLNNELIKINNEMNSLEL